MWIEFLGLTYFELMPLNLQMQMTKIMKSSFFHVGRYSMKCKVLLLFFFRVSWIALSSRNSDMWVCHSYCSIVVEQFLNTPLVLEYWSEQGVHFFFNQTPARCSAVASFKLLMPPVSTSAPTARLLSPTSPMTRLTMTSPHCGETTDFCLKWRSSSTKSELSCRSEESW